MKTIKESGRGHKQKDRKSIFIGTAYKISSKEEARSALEKVRQEFPKATHNAFAYRIGVPVEWEECSDDGEVKGCAGKPLITILQKKELTNILIIVTRFYGGVKLGPGRLLRNYSQCAAKLLELIETEAIM